MSHLPVTALDLVVLGVVLISALLAAVRGFTREVLAIASWVAAAAAAYVLHPMVLPYAKEYIPNAQLALAASIGAVFLLTLIIVSFITVKISDLILDSKIGALDRTLGFLFGAARGLLIAVIAFVFFDKLVGEKQQPEWVKDAKLRPVLKETGDQIIALLPEDPEGMIAKWKARKRMEGEQGDPGEPPAAPATPAQPGTAPAPADPQKKTEARPSTQTAKVDGKALENLIDNTAGHTPAKR
jgi:membrane protein required for colicin V production